MPEPQELIQLRNELTQADGPADLAGTWPEELWDILHRYRAFHWLVPENYGGSGLDRPSLMSRYMAIAQGSLTAAFMLTQHDAALRRLIPAAGKSESGEDNLAARWLRRITRENLTITVGISQLTTSIRRGEQAMKATIHESDGYLLEGSMPWVTGAEKASAFVTGASLEDGRQILVLLPADRIGVEVQDPEPLAALNASRTTEVICKNVKISSEEVLAGPVENVITSRQAGGTGGLETSVLALGLAKAAIEALQQEEPERFALSEPVEHLSLEWAGLESDLFAFLNGLDKDLSPERIRQRANVLVSRATQACLIAKRGTGFLLTNAAQRWARQSLFFHVWSCPKPVAKATIRELSGVIDPGACGE